MAGRDMDRYVREALARGYSEAGIRRRLLDAGYEEADVDAAIRGALRMESAPPKHAALHVLIPLLLLLAAAGTVVLIDPTVFGMFRSPAPSPLGSTDAPPSVQECGEDAACLIAAAQECAPARMRMRTVATVFGMVVEDTSLLTINGSRDGRCVFLLLSERQSVSFGEELRARLRASGVADEEIARSEAEANATAQRAVATPGTCLIAAPDLAALLASWEGGNASADDLSGYACSGPLFDADAE